MQITEMRNEAAMLLRAARTEKGDRRTHMLEEAQLWIDLMMTAPAAPPEEVPSDTVMRIRTRGDALTVVQEQPYGVSILYPWQCLGCGLGGDKRRGEGGSNRDHARQAATEHARECWVEPAPAADNQATVPAAA
ncbi:hypothetical protein ACJ6WE_39970 [Streptomyces sp. MMS24-I31]|uniref:hypothetical protein n=1 Tax=Streptomyces sp. MMS24-I31 TaxID=3351563 RepID=UPI003896D528